MAARKRIQEVEHFLAQLAKKSDAFAQYVRIFQMLIFQPLSPAEIARREKVTRNYVDLSVSRVRDALDKYFTD